MRRSFRSTIIFMGLAALTLTIPAAAQGIGPCNGTPGERQVGQENKIGYIVPICEFPPPQAQTQYAHPIPAPEPMIHNNNYAVIVWHPNARATWIGKNFRNETRAENRTLAACQETMGDGCKKLGSVWNGYLLVGSDPYGALTYGVGDTERKALHDFKKSCEANKLKNCTPIQKAWVPSFLDFVSTIDPTSPEIIEPEGDFRRRWAAIAMPDEKAPIRRSLDTIWVQGGFISEDSAKQAVLKKCQEEARTKCSIAQTVADLHLFAAWDQKHSHRIFVAPVGEGAAKLKGACDKDKDECLLIMDYASERTDTLVLQMGEEAWKLSKGKMGYRIEPDGKLILPADSRNSP